MPLVPAKWLGEHVELPENLTATELAAALVKVGLEEEEIHAADITGPVVVGKVLSREPKEQSNGKVINYCRVDVGAHNDEPGTGKEPSELPSRGIICGAHNFEVGDYVCASLPGAVLPGGFAIAARKTYGHVSDGMLCSTAELGMGDDGQHGIIVLAHSDDEAAQKGIPALGEDVLGYLGLGAETLEINITPDRGYCFSMRGVAREYHHSTGAAFIDPGLPENLSAPLPAATESGFNIEIRDDAPIHGVAGCDRFVTRVVRGVDPTAPSPKWLQDRLVEAGMRSISLAVDATNYVMLDLGQPLHAYDLDTLNGPIVVRRARAGEKLVTLDDIERELHPEDLLITDSAAERVLALAGVMGGADTEITDKTVNVLVEAAHFDAVSIARTARRHKLPTEAGKRFERGVDPLVAPVAAQKVVDLLVEYGGGTATDEVFDLATFEMPAAQPFALSEVARLTGLELSDARIIEVLTDIGCLVDGTSGVVQVTPPTWRPDLVGPAHFVEEVARLVGYDEIPVRLPAAPAGRGLTVTQRQRRDISRSLAEQGWVQVLSYPFVAISVFDRQGFASDDDRRVSLRLINPLQDEVGLMRTSILDTLLETAHLNIARGNQTVAVFETSVITDPRDITPKQGPAVGSRPSDEDLAQLIGATPKQPYHVAGVAIGPKNASAYGVEVSQWDWRDAIEAAVEAARAIGVTVEVVAAERAPWHPGRCAEIRAAGATVGYAGEIAPAVCKAFELPARTVAFEIDTDVLGDASNEPLVVRAVNVNPVAKEDIALVVDATVTAGELEAVIREAAGNELEDVRLFDVYTGEQLGEGKKSLAFALRLRGDHTMTADETARVRKRVLKAARKAFNAELRS